MKTIPLSEAQQTLIELVHGLAPDEVVILTENDRPVAQIAYFPAIPSLRPRPPMTGIPKAGALEGRLIVPDDFDEPLEELREYME